MTLWPSIIFIHFSYVNPLKLLRRSKSAHWFTVATHFDELACHGAVSWMMERNTIAE